MAKTSPSREREREFNRTFVSLFDVDLGNDIKRRRKARWDDYMRKNNDHVEIEPIDYFMPGVMNVNGLMNNPKDTTINNKSTYARVLIQVRS